MFSNEDNPCHIFASLIRQTTVRSRFQGLKYTVKVRIYCQQSRAGE
ncbi:MAG: hypothetical protein VZR33_10045 [Methanosphaera sp.]|nr:hypothetical protein [Methanosphaera sp.]